MPRIPRAEQSVGVSGQPMPYSSGDGYAAPGKALQEFGKGISSVALAFQQQQDEDDAFQANMAATRTNSDLQNDFDTFRDNYTGDPNQLLNTWRSEHLEPRLQEFRRSVPGTPRAQQRAALQEERFRGNYTHNANTFHTTYRQHHLVGQLDATINTTIGGLPSADETSVQTAIDVLNAQIDQARLDPLVKQHLRGQAATLLMAQVKAIGAASDKDFPHSGQFRTLQRLINRWGGQRPAGQDGIPYPHETEGVVAPQAAGVNNQARGRMQIGQQIFRYFVGRGMQPHQAAAVAGNMAWEGGGTADLVNPNDNVRNSPSSPHSFGIGQWNDRLPALIRFAKSQGIDVPQGNLRDVSYVRSLGRAIPLQTQLDFAWTEMQGSEGRAGRGISGAANIRAATAAAIGYHRPAGWTSANPEAGHGFSGRLSLAHRIMRAGPAGAAGPGGAVHDPYGSSPQINEAQRGPAVPVVQVAGSGDTQVAQAPLTQPTIQTELMQHMITALPQARAHAAAELRQAIDKYAPVAAEGKLPTTGEIERLEAQIARFGDPDIRARFDSLLGQAMVSRELNRSHPDEVAQILHAARNEQQRLGTTPEREKRIDQLTKLHTAMTTRIKNDALGHANDAGVREVPPLVYGDPASWGVRLQIAREVAQRYRQPIQYFYPSERDHLAAQARERDLKMALLFKEIVERWGPDHAMAAIQQFAADQPDAMRLGALIARGANAQTVETALAGMQLQKTPGFKPLPEPATARTLMQNVVGDALNIAPRDMTTAQHLANTIFQQLATTRGVTAKDSNYDAVWQEAFAMAIGQSTIGGTQYGGAHYQSRGWFGGGSNGIILPPTMSPQHFSKAFDKITHEDLIAAGLSLPAGRDGKPISMARLRSGNVTLVPAGDGRFYVAHGSPTNLDQAEWVGTVPLANPDYGTPASAGDHRFVIDLNKLAPELYQRTPELFREAPAPRVGPTLTRSAPRAEIDKPGLHITGPARHTPPPASPLNLSPRRDDIGDSIEGRDPAQPPRMGRRNLGHPPGQENVIPSDKPKLLMRHPDDDGPPQAPDQDFISIDDPSAVIPETTLQQLRNLPADTIEPMGYRRRRSPWAPNVVPTP